MTGPLILKTNPAEDLEAATKQYVDNHTSDVVFYTPQTLTDEQKAQARGNINSAPGGFGLGGNAKWLTEADDVNAISESGWYAWDSPHTPKNAINLAYSTIMRVDAENAAVNIKTLYGVADNLLGAAIVARNMTYGSHISDWEYENPLMQLGVEYRTTERYLGKPVYIKAVDFGSLPNNTIKTVTFGDNTIKMISAHGIMNGGYIIPGCTGSTDYPEQEMQIFACDGGTVGIMTHIDRSKARAVIVAKYWKTTD